MSLQRSAASFCAAAGPSKPAPPALPALVALSAPANPTEPSTAAAVAAAAAAVAVSSPSVSSSTSSRKGSRRNKAKKRRSSGSHHAPDTDAPPRKRRIINEALFDCPICLSPCSSRGKHRICSLKCGHMFGHSCLLQHLKTRDNCPTCKAAARTTHVRLHYVPDLVVLDTSERDRARQERDEALEEVRTLRESLQLVQRELGKQTRKAIAAEQAYLKLRQEHDRLEETRGDSASVASHMHADVARFRLGVEAARVCAFAAHPHASLLVAGRQDKHTVIEVIPLEPGAADDGAHAFVPLAHAPVRDMQVSPDGQRLLCTGFDKRLSVIDLGSRTVVQSIELDRPGWSCAWLDAARALVGINGKVYLFDLCSEQEPAPTVFDSQTFHPIVAVSAVGTQLLAVTASQVLTWPLDDPSALRVLHKFAHKCSSFCTVPSSGQETFVTALASFRTPASALQVPASHALLQVDVGPRAQVRCVYRVSGHTASKSQSRACLFAHAGQWWVAGADEQSLNCWLWRRQRLMCKLAPHPSVVVDVQYCAHSQRLAVLSEGVVTIHEVP